MLEPYEWKRSRTVLRRERGSNPSDLADYSKPPKTKPVLQYQWFEGNSPAHVDTEIKGANSSTYTPDRAGKYVKVQVTGIEGAAGTVESNSKKTFSNLI